MKNKSSRDAGRDGNDSAPPPIRENAKGKYHQDGQYSDFGYDQSHGAALSSRSIRLCHRPEYVPLATHIPVPEPCHNQTDLLSTAGNDLAASVGLAKR